MHRSFVQPRTPERESYDGCEQQADGEASAHPGMRFSSSNIQHPTSREAPNPKLQTAPRDIERKQGLAKPQGG
jgi:hypothetical protein